MDLVLIGAANPETNRMLARLRRSKPDLRVVGFLDNDPAKAGTSFLGLPVFGSIVDEAERLIAGGAYFVNLITRSTRARYETSRAVAERGGLFTNLISPDIDLMDTSIGVGNYFQEQVVLQAGVRVGNNCSIHCAAVVAHESLIGNTVFIAPAASICGVVEIGDGTFVGSNATILPRTKIGRWCEIGAGAVVHEEVPDGSLVIGNPARVLKRFDLPYQDADVFAGGAPQFTP